MILRSALMPSVFLSDDQPSVACPLRGWGAGWDAPSCPPPGWAESLGLASLRLGRPQQATEQLGWAAGETIPLCPKSAGMLQQIA